MKAPKKVRERETESLQQPEVPVVEVATQETIDDIVSWCMEGTMKDVFTREEIEDMVCRAIDSDKIDSIAMCPQSDEYKLSYVRQPARWALTFKPFTSVYSGKDYNDNKGHKQGETIDVPRVTLLFAPPPGKDRYISIRSRFGAIWPDGIPKAPHYYPHFWRQQVCFGSFETVVHAVTEARNFPALLDILVQMMASFAYAAPLNNRYYSPGQQTGRDYY